MGKTFSTGLLTNGIWQDASNNIGIGGSPSGSYKLEVTGTAKVSSTLLVSGAATFATDVTIGSPTTNATLSISGDNSGGDSFLNFKADVGAIKGQIQGTKNGANGGIIYFKTLQSSTLTTAMTIKEANIGIGTSSFYSKFAVKLSGATAPATVANTTGFDTTYVTFGNDTISGKQLGIGVSQTNQDGSYLISVAPASEWINLSLYAKDNIFYGNGTERLRLSGTGTLSHNTSGVSSIVLGASANYANISSGGYGATLYMNGATRGGTGGATSGSVVLATDAFFSVTDSSTNNAKMTLESTGNLILSRTTYSSIQAIGCYTDSASSGATLSILSGGNILRYSSSLRFKSDVETLDSNLSESIYKMRPIWYRSLCDADRKDWSWYGLAAEELAEIEPRLVQWGYKREDYIINEETKEQELKEGAELIADGVHYDRITVLLVAEMQKMNKLVQELSAQNQDLKSRLDKAGL